MSYTLVVNDELRSGIAEDAKVRGVLDALVLPPEIESVNVETRPDSTGDPGLYVIFGVKGDANLDDEAVRRLTAFTSDVTVRLLQAHVSAFPYTLLQQAA